MVITFNELRRIKDKLPSGSSQRIADELNIDVNVVRNYFGGTHFKEGGPVGIHLEKGPDGGVVTLDDASILEGDRKRSPCRFASGAKRVSVHVGRLRIALTRSCRKILKDKLTV